jgi:hypothetical protein
VDYYDFDTTSHKWPKHVWKLTRAVKAYRCQCTMGKKELEIEKCTPLNYLDYKRH